MTPGDFKRARDLVLKYGWNTTCFQIVNPGIEYWFGDDGRSVVGYDTSGGVRVVVGAPVCEEYAIALAFTENKPFRVLFQGLAKAIVAEARNFRRWLKT